MPYPQEPFSERYRRIITKGDKLLLKYNAGVPQKTSYSVLLRDLERVNALLQAIDEALAECQLREQWVSQLASLLEKRETLHAQAVAQQNWLQKVLGTLPETTTRQLQEFDVID